MQTLFQLRCNWPLTANDQHNLKQWHRYDQWQATHCSNHSGQSRMPQPGRPITLATSTAATRNQPMKRRNTNCGDQSDGVWHRLEWHEWPWRDLVYVSALFDDLGTSTENPHDAIKRLFIVDRVSRVGQVEWLYSTQHTHTHTTILAILHLSLEMLNR